MPIAFLDKGQHQMVAGSIDASAGTDAVLTSADGAATMTRNDAGDYTVTFGAAFLSAPIITATPVDATFSTDETHMVTGVAVNATDVQFNVITTTTNATATDIASALADIDFHFMCVGARNR